MTSEEVCEFPELSHLDKRADAVALRRYYQRKDQRECECAPEQVLPGVAGGRPHARIERRD
jgi:hypothetical protein